jgi:predicted XRE-type DNA-binding protein
MSTNKKRGDYVRDAADIINVDTDRVHVPAVEDILGVFQAARHTIDETRNQARRWVLGLINANGWSNGEAAHALGLTPNRVGLLISGKVEALTEVEMLTMLNRTLLIDVDDPLTPIEISVTEGKSKLHKVS